MADTSTFKGGMIAALIMVAGLTYWNRSSDAAEIKTVCLAQLGASDSIRNPEAICTCYVNAIMRQLSILHFVPLIRAYQPEPSRAITNEAGRLCGGG